MIHLDNMSRQHSAILNEVNYLENEIKKPKDEINVTDAALHINRLAGHLKIHLMEEDRYLYPELLKQEDQALRQMAQQYIDEMGSLAEAYNGFKNAFNMSSKIKQDMDHFIAETKEILSALKKRMEKEDNQLYRMITERGL